MSKRIFKAEQKSRKSSETCFQDFFPRRKRKPLRYAN